MSSRSSPSASAGDVVLDARLAAACREFDRGIPRTLHVTVDDLSRFLISDRRMARAVERLAVTADVLDQRRVMLHQLIRYLRLRIGELRAVTTGTAFSPADRRELKQLGFRIYIHGFVGLPRTLRACGVIVGP